MVAAVTAVRLKVCDRFAFASFGARNDEGFNRGSVCDREFVPARAQSMKQLSPMIGLQKSFGRKAEKSRGRLFARKQSGFHLRINLEFGEEKRVILGPVLHFMPRDIWMFGRETVKQRGDPV